MACKDCFSGTLHEGTPTGRVETVHGLPCYIAEPPNGQQPKGVVVIVPDAFGWKFNNNRILSDKYAAKGNFRVLLPEFMDGCAASSDYLSVIDYVTDENVWWPWKIPSVLKMIPNFGSFFYFTRSSVCGPRITNFFHDVRSSTSLPIGTAGFCWGGKYVVMLGGKERAADGTSSLFDCAYIAHPSMLSLPGEIEAFNLPLSWAHGTKDTMVPEAMATQMEQVLESKRSEIDTEFVRYEGAKHGFAVRNQPGDEKEKQAGEDAMDQAVNFFSKQFSRSK